MDEGKISLGCNARGVMHTEVLPLADQFRMVRDSGVFDHFDRIPQPGEEREYVDASNKYGMPLTTGLWTYQIGRDEHLVQHNLEWASKAGAKCHNLMISTHHANGHVVTNEEVTEFYLRAYEVGEKFGILISVEVHIYMFTEDFRRVTPVAELVRSRGVPFNFVLDHSHVLLKIESAEEQDASGIRGDVESGKLILDPYDKTMLSTNGFSKTWSFGSRSDRFPLMAQRIPPCAVWVAVGDAPVNIRSFVRNPENGVTFGMLTALNRVKKWCVKCFATITIRLTVRCAGLPPT